MLVRRGLANWSCTASRVKSRLSQLQFYDGAETNIEFKFLKRNFNSNHSAPKNIEEVVKKFGRFHVNPDHYEIKATRAVPDSIERPMWMRPNFPKKFDNYEGLTKVTDPEEVNSSQSLIKSSELQPK